MLACSFANSFRDTPFKELLLSPHSKRSSVSDPICEANTKHKVWIQRVAFFEYRPYPQVCTHEVHGWELKSGRAGGIGDNSSW